MSIKTYSYRNMDEDMRVRVRLHKRLSGLNDVLDNELNYKVNKITKDQRRAFAQLETGMKLLKRELSKCSLNSDKELDLSQNKTWDKPSAVVLKARMMIKTNPLRKNKSEEKDKYNREKILPKNVIRLEDLPRIRYELKQKLDISKDEGTTNTYDSEENITTSAPNSSELMTNDMTSSYDEIEGSDTVSDELVFELFPKRLIHRRKSLPVIFTPPIISTTPILSTTPIISTTPILSTTPIISTTQMTKSNCKTFRRGSIQSNQLELIDFKHNRTEIVPDSRLDRRRSSIQTDIECVQFKVPTQSERRRQSLPNIMVKPNTSKCSSRLNGESDGNEYLEVKFNKCTGPSNSERRVLMRKSSSFRIYRYLADEIPNMSNQTLADIHSLRQTIADNKT